MVKRRTMRKSKNRSRSRSRSSKRSRSMRGGRLSGDSSYSSLIAGSSDNSSYVAMPGVAAIQDSDRNNSSISGEGAPINMSAPAFQGLIPPQAYYGGKRRRSRKSHRRTMRGGESNMAGTAMIDASESNNVATLVKDFEASNNDMAPTQLVDGAVTGGRRRRHRRGRRSMRGGNDVEGASDSNEIMSQSTAVGGRRRRRSMRGGEVHAGPMPTTAENPSGPLPNLEGGRRRRSMRGGMYDPPATPTPMLGGSKKRRGGGIIATAALPFGLFGLQRLFQGRNKSHGQRTRRHRRR